jgi:hypothetical protein
MFLRAMPWLLRRIRRPNTWREATLCEDHFREAFTAGAEPVSVYQVETDIQEAEVAAALSLCAGAHLSNPEHLLRIPVEDAVALQLELRETPGSTGVLYIDAMHRDLVGDPIKFRALACQIVGRSGAGQDTVRTVAGRGLSQRIANFLDSGILGNGFVRNARQALDKADRRWPRQ